jgi:hypothetical protein
MGSILGIDQSSITNRPSGRKIFFIKIIKNIEIIVKNLKCIKYINYLEFFHYFHFFKTCVFSY